MKKYSEIQDKDLLSILGIPGPVKSEIIQKHLLLQSQKIQNLKDLLRSRLPFIGESFHIITQNQFDAFSFVLLILQYEVITDLWAAVYRIGEKTTKALIQLSKTGQIEKVNLVLNDGFKAFSPDVDRLIVLNQKKINVIRCNNHSKVILAKTASSKHYVVEGSGNWSINARIEQYCFLQSQEIYEFHKNWMESYMVNTNE